MANNTDAVLAAPEMVQLALKVTHYAFPALCFLYFVLALSITVCTLQTQSLRVKDQHVRRNVMIALLLAVTGTYIAQAVAILTQRFLKTQPGKILDSDLALKGTSVAEDLAVYVLGSILVFGVQVLALTEAKFPVWYPYYATWFLAIVVETALLVVPDVYDHPESIFDFVVTAIQAVRIALFIILISLYFGLRNDKKQYDNSDAERQSLLQKKLAPKQGSEDSSTGNGYGGTATTENVAQSETAEDASDAGSEDSWLAERRKAEGKVAERLKQDGNWFTYAKGFAIFFPYIWPVHDNALQFRAVLVGMCLLASNALNVLVPRQMGIMIDGLKNRAQAANPEEYTNNVFLPVVMYAVLLFANGGACVGWLRKWLWMPVEQYSYDALSTASHAHLMSLSSDFHDSKTSSDLTQAVSGGRSVSDLLETVCFQVLPMFIDLAVAFGYLWHLFGPYMGFIMAVTVISYLYITTKLVAIRAEKRRDYVTVYRKEWTVGQQSLDGWSTASLFNMIPYERHRYACAVKEHMQVKRSYELSSQSIGAAQGLVMTFGLLGALFLGVYQVVYDNKSIGQFTTLLVYWAQLQSPLVFFSSMYRSISYSLMDAERLLELFQTKPTVVDLPKAKTLKLGKGEVKFDHVSFAYDERKPTLKDVSFIVPAGKTVAIVGETGGGKSTILKLILRFYDVKSGSISIDGQDLRNCTLDSVRSKIGTVPQDPMLFNDSIMNNVRYARISASDKEVYEACQAAAIHDKIMSFPDGYNSKVGDRGVKLSGGEKQRVAIARAMLKKPEIVLLDEATSAVDTDTEHKIQEGFRALCKDRTTFIVAHRLSTIMRADRILVVMNGEIVEEGTHDELIHAKGRYLRLWSKQVYVKPADGRARSLSPKKRDAEIINDLTPTRQKAELAKVLQTTAHEEPASHQESTEQSVKGPMKESSKESPKVPFKWSSTDVSKEPSKQLFKEPTKEPVKQSAKQVVKEPAKGDGEASTKGKEVATGGTKREGSKLKPDAPEFVPNTPKANDRSPSKTDPKSAAKEQRKQDKLEKEQQKQQRRATSSVGKKSGKSLGRHDGGDDMKDLTADESNSAEMPTEQLVESSVSGTDKTKPKRRFNHRRQMAKSEPAGRVEESFDGTQDSDITAVSSGEGHPLIQQHRRVSAPSDPPSGPSHYRAGPRRRARGWRLKNRVGENSGSGTTSGTTTSDDGAMPPPPATTPAEGVQPIATTIRFAPGF